MQNKTLARAVVGLSGLVLGGVAWGQLCVLPGNTAFHDDVNNLTWLRNPPTATVNWTTAGTNAISASGLGGTGRLPTRAEYSSLYPQLAGNGSVVGTYSTASLYWTSETSPGGGGNQRYTVNLATGSTTNTNNQNNQLLYWPVRTDSTSVCPATTGCSASGYTTRLTSATTPTLSLAITGQQINANSPGGENWKEIHCGTSGGALQKVGVSPTDPVDPQTTVGTWTISGDTVIYNYGTGGSYTWRVYRNPTSGGICWQENSDTGAIIATGTVGAAISCVP
jgi:hypothetical protein